MAYWSTEHRSDPGLYPTEDAPSQENLVVLDGTHAVEAMEAGAVACPVVRVEE